MNVSTNTPERPAAVKSAAEVAAFYDRFSDRLVRDQEAGNPRVAMALEAVRQEIRRCKRPPTRVLDVGCGIGWTTDQIARSAAERGGGDLKILGVDISPENIRRAEARYGGRSAATGIDFAVSDLTEVPPGGPWDLVTMIDVYEHLPAADRDTFHRVLAGCLADEATFVLTTPSPFHQAYLREHLPEELQVVDETVTVDDLARLAEDAGGTLVRFEMVSVWRTCDYVHTVIRRGGCYEPLPPRPLPVRRQIRRAIGRAVRSVTGRRRNNTRAAE